MRKLWSRIQNDPAFLRTFNGWLTWFWLLNFPPVITLYLVMDSTTFQAFCLLYLALVSIWANVAGHWSGWQAARTEVAQADAADQVVEAMVKRTTVEKAE